jgi:6-phosphogluconolactonase
MGRAIGRVELSADPLALAHHVAEWMMQAALAAPGPFRVSLSGGSTPKTLYGLLASDEFRGRFPWPRVSWYWGDERFVPHDHPDSNYRMAREAMLIKAQVSPENIHAIPTDGTPEDAALRYEQTLQEAYGALTLDPRRTLFDVTLLGLGPDGHTASLLPGEPVLNERRHWVAAVSHGRPEVRITMTIRLSRAAGASHFWWRAKKRPRSSAGSAPAIVRCRRHAFDQLASCIGLSIERRPAWNSCPVAQERARDEVCRSFHARIRAYQRARWDAVDHHSALSPIGRFRSIG